MSPIDTRSPQSQVVRERSDAAQGGSTSRTGSAESFSRMLDRRPQAPTSQQVAGERVAGWKTLQAAQQRTLDSRSNSSLNRYAAYQDVTKTLGSMKGKLKKTGDATLDTMKDSMEMNAEQNMRYLELQQRMQEENIAHDCVSNLMKARAESVKNSINTIQ